MDSPDKSGPAASDYDLDPLLEGVNLPSNFALLSVESLRGVSVRLHNAYENSGAESLAEFLKRGREGRAALLNYGKKTEDVLRGVVRELLASGPREVVKATATGDTEILGPTYESLLGHPDPWKMTNDRVWRAWGLALAKTPERRVCDVAEQLGLPWPDNRRDATLQQFLAMPWAKVGALPAVGRIRRRTLSLTTAYVVAHRDGVVLASIGEILSLPVIKNLDPRERRILERRLLVPGPSQVTLETMGAAEEVTRERIRQVESGILRRLRESGYSQRLAELLDESKDEIFQRLSGGELGLTDRRLEISAQEFGGTELLAIYVQEGNLRPWLDRNFQREVHGWFGGTMAEWREIKRRLSPWREEQLPLPEAVIAGSSNATVREVRAYFQLTGSGTVFEGYVLPDNHATAKRAARLHAFINAEGWAGKEPLLAADACARASREPDGADYGRNGFIAMLRAPTLFLVSSGAVVPIFPGAPWRHGTVDLSEMAEVRAGGPTEELMATIMRAQGPLPTAVLVEKCQADRQLNLAASSVTVMLRASTRFARLAPGLYDLRELSREAARRERARGALMNERDVRRYSIARYSGDNVGELYPLWDFEQEKRWAIWGQRALPVELWESLMWVATPGAWPKGKSDRLSEWREWKEQGRWKQKVAWQDELPENLPAVRDVLLVARCARISGHMTWIRANNILGSTITHERAGLTAVTLGVVLGLLTPTGESRWRVQSPSPTFDRGWIEFENLLLSDHNPSWMHPVLSAWFSRASLRAAAGELGWVTANEVSLLRQLSSKQVISLRHEPESDALAAMPEDGDDIKI